jgi:multiple RNA-binding domain-containing protein 1
MERFLGYSYIIELELITMIYEQTERKQDNQMTDMDFLMSKIKKDWSDSESDDENNDDQSKSTGDGEKSFGESSDVDEKSQIVDLRGNLGKKNNMDNGTTCRIY